LLLKPNIGNLAKSKLKYIYWKTFT